MHMASCPGIPFSKAMTASDMKRISDDFAKAAIKLKKAGFDAIELHMGHWCTWVGWTQGMGSGK